MGWAQGFRAMGPVPRGPRGRTHPWSGFPHGRADRRALAAQAAHPLRLASAGHVSGVPPWVGSGASSGTSRTGWGASISAHSDRPGRTCPARGPLRWARWSCCWPGRGPRVPTPAEQPRAPAPPWAQPSALGAGSALGGWRRCVHGPLPGAASACGPATPTRVTPAGLWPCGHSREVGHVVSLAVTNFQCKRELGHTSRLLLEKQSHKSPRRHWCVLFPRGPNVRAERLTWTQLPAGGRPPP